jgi:MFS family permease
MATSHPPEPEALAGPLRSLFLTVMPPIVLPVYLAVADSVAVATALPAIGATFGNVEMLQWVVVANLIASTIASPVYGRLGDLLGRRRLMLVSLGLFMLASLCCAAAPGMNALLAARAVQGLGSGGLVTLSQALLGEHVPSRLIGKYQGYFAACIVAGSCLGPVGGGLLTSWFGWPAVFLANVPLGAAAILLVLRLPAATQRRGEFVFDLFGLVLLALLIVPVLLALSELRDLNSSVLPLVTALLGVAALALPAFIWQQRRTRLPLLPLGLLRNPAIWRANVMSACSGGSLVAMVTFLPIYFQVVMGASPAESGLLLLPLTAAVSGGSVMTGWLVSRTGRTAVFPGFGLIVTALSLVALALWAPEMDRVQLSVVLAIGGLCQGSAMLVAQITGQLTAGLGQLGVVAGALQLFRSLGSAFGAALAGAVLFAVLAALDPQTAQLFGDMVKQGPRVLAALPAEQQAVVQSEIAAGFRGVFLTVACFSVTIVGMAWTLPMRRV